jgi:hypothetical protein
MNNQDIASRIPRTKEEMERTKEQIGNNITQETINKAYKINASIDKAKEMARMFKSEPFQAFWKLIHDDLKELTDRSVRDIKGSPGEKNGYDPFGQLVQLNIIQGGLELLESQEMQISVIIEQSKREPIDTTEMEEKLKVINQ